MKTTLLLLALGSLQSAFAARNPVKEVHNLHYLYKNFELQGQKVKVEGSYSPEGSNTVNSRGDEFIVPKAEFDREKQLGLSVLKAGRGRKVKNSQFTSGDAYDGTAFVVGDDYVLTNFHVFSRTFNQKASCTGFSLTLDHGGKESFECEKKVKCNVELDYCLLKTKKEAKRVEVLINGKKRKRKKFFSISHFVDPLILYPKELLLSEPSATLLAIGNGGGFGIQASQGEGLYAHTLEREPVSKIAKVFLHHATVVSGNSGGPLIDEQNRVIAINTKQKLRARVKRNNKVVKDGYEVSEDAYNFATTVYAILKDLEKDPQIKKEVLPFLNIR